MVWISHPCNAPFTRLRGASCRRRHEQEAPRHTLSIRPAVARHCMEPPPQMIMKLCGLHPSFLLFSKNAVYLSLWTSDFERSPAASALWTIEMPSPLAPCILCEWRQTTITQHASLSHQASFIGNKREETASTLTKPEPLDLLGSFKRAWPCQMSKPSCLSERQQKPKAPLPCFHKTHIHSLQQCKSPSLVDTTTSLLPRMRLARAPLYRPQPSSGIYLKSEPLYLSHLSADAVQY